MHKLYLHIGHGKTGSSYIQSALARSIEILEGLGIVYPEPADKESAALGHISSGNINNFHSFLREQKNISPLDYLFSSEFIFHLFMNEEFRSDLINLVQRTGTQLSVLLFIRDPVAHGCSAYQQLIKREGETGTLSEFFAQYQAPRHVNLVLDALESIPDITLKVMNYSAGKPIIPIVEAWLGIPSNTLATPPASVVNRSLTVGELELQRQINARSGISGQLAADRFCNELPDIPSEPVRPSLSDQEQLWERLAPEIEKVNKRVEPHARYLRQRDLCATSASCEDREFHFSREQLAVIAGGLSHTTDIEKTLFALDARLKELRAEHDRLRADYNSLRAEHHALRSSRSWRLTAPLRTLRAKLSRRANAPVGAARSPDK